jgi:hypothetical protein
MGTGAFDGAILVTDGETPSPDVPGVELDTDAAPFHFGRRLADVIRRHEPASVVYMGGGSLPLLPPRAFADIAESLSGEVVVTNNAYSSDLVAFPLVPWLRAPALSAFSASSRPSVVITPWPVPSGVPVSCRTPPRTIETQFDIDSPTDLAVLSLAQAGGPRLRAYLDT